MSKSKRAVVVTTEFRGVFFGYLSADHSPEHVVLTDARMCISWSTSIRGVLGLASVGPDAQCRVGYKVPRITLIKITSIMGCTPEAIAKWEAAPWN